MATWQKIVVPIVVCAAIAGGYLAYVFHSRHAEDEAATKQTVAQSNYSQDDLAVVREHFYSSFDSAKGLEGTDVWMKTGYAMPYYPYAGQVQFAKRVGLLPPAEKMHVVKLVKAVAPAKEDDRIDHGTRQYFVAFTLPEDKDAVKDGKPATFATPIGVADGSDEKVYSDRLLYYDAPQKIYDNWPQDVWAAVAAHTPKVGMSELQTQMALGVNQQSDSQDLGNRTVTYDADGKKWIVTFVKNKATAVKQG